jgi:hypothetical protein
MLPLAAADVGIPDVVVVDVDIDVTAVPATVVSPAVPPCGSQGDSQSKSESRSRHIAGIDIRRIGIDRRSINHDRIV